LCRINAAGLINGGFVQRNVETISQSRGRDPDLASRNTSPAATSIGYSRTPRRKLLRVTIRRNWRKGPLQRIGGRPRSLARIRVESPMSALGQKPTFCDVQAMSSLPTKKRKFGGAMECPPEADMSVQRHNRSGLRTSSSHSVSFVSVIWDRRFIAKRRSRLQQRSDK
jgi:hypothetical protein